MNAVYDSGVPGIPTPAEIDDAATEAKLDEIETWAVASLSETYDLIHVAYDDKFTDEQVEWIVEGDMESLWDSTAMWEMEARDYGVEYHADEVYLAIGREFGDEWADEFKNDDRRWDDLRLAISERESGSWYRDLLNHTPDVLLRVPLGDEDTLWIQEDDEAGALLDAIGFAPTPENLDNAWAITANSWGGMVFALFTMPLSEIDGLHEDDTVEVVNPHILISNPYAGDGYEDALEGRLTFRAGDLRTDEGAPGYSWDSIAGVVKSYYSTNVNITRTERNAA